MEYHRAGVPALCHKFCYRLSASLSHSADTASDGIRQSPRGESVTVPTFGPSGRQERLNCCVKKRRMKVVSHFLHARKGLVRGAEDLARRITEAQHIIQEKVMQLIRADQILGLLADLAVLRRQQFG